MSDIQDTIKERGGTHGSYYEQSETADTIKQVFSVPDNHQHISHDMRESLDHIAVKISRILHGDPNHADHWRDIAGYAMLIVNRLEGK